VTAREEQLDALPNGVYRPARTIAQARCGARPREAAVAIAHQGDPSEDRKRRERAEDDGGAKKTEHLELRLNEPQDPWEKRADDRHANEPR
jgi:hypothetical protein